MIIDLSQKDAEYLLACIHAREKGIHTGTLIPQGRRHRRELQRRLEHIATPMKARRARLREQKP